MYERKPETKEQVLARFRDIYSSALNDICRWNLEFQQGGKEALVRLCDEMIPTLAEFMAADDPELRNDALHLFYENIWSNPNLDAIRIQQYLMKLFLKEITQGVFNYLQKKLKLDLYDEWNFNLLRDIIGLLQDLSAGVKQTLELETIRESLLQDKKWEILSEIKKWKSIRYDRSSFERDRIFMEAIEALQDEGKLVISKLSDVIEVSLKDSSESLY